jgi:hypothetical protein
MRKRSSWKLGQPTVIRDVDESTLTDYMFRTHTAPSLMAGNGYDFISTAELDNQP